MLGYDGQSGGIPVQTINTAEHKRTVLLCKIIGKAVCQGIVIIVHGRVDRHACRLIDHHEILVLVDDIQRQLHRWDFFRGMFLVNMQSQGISRLQYMIHEAGNPVCLHGGGVFF